MPQENRIETDVLVVGGSMAGLFAAIKARERGAKVTLVEKGYTGKAGAALFANFLQVFNSEWGHNLKDWMAWIAGASEYVNDPEWTEATLKDSYGIYKDLMSWGVRFETDQNGEPLRCPTRGILDALMYKPARDFLFLMRKQAVKTGVNVMDRIMVTNLIKQDGKVAGAVGFHTVSGEFYVFQAGATVLCTGNGGVGGNEDIGSRLVSNGETMAYEVGAEIGGKEFSLTGMTPSSGTHGEKIGGKKISLKGKKVKPFPPKFHMLNISIPHSIDAEGNEIGHYDLAAVHQGKGPTLWNLSAGTPEEIELAMWRNERTSDHPDQLSRADLLKGGLYSGMTRHESHMGRAVDGGSAGTWSAGLDGSTSLPGLYAAGDCYYSRAVGAKYPGFGMGTRNAASTGSRAGVAAAEFASKVKKTALDSDQVARLKNYVYAPLERPGGFDPDWVTQQLRGIMLPYYIWTIRHEKRMQAALTLVEFLNEHISPQMYARPRDGHGLRLVHEARTRLVNTEMLLKSAIFRTESRGNHYREDYPMRDDPGWLALVKLRQKNGKMELSKEPIPKKYWPDLSLPYRERYPAEYLGEDAAILEKGIK
jgi:succinate dehydrogenase/fumarate reductase flavoprotein subunit